MIADRIFFLSAALASGLVAATATAQTIVPTPPFNAIELEGGGHVTLMHGSVQQVRLLKGSTQFTRFIVERSQPHKLRIEACNNDCPHNYDLEVEITTPGIDTLAVSGGGRIESGGDFPARHQLTLAVDGGGTIDVRAMRSEGATAAVDGMRWASRRSRKRPKRATTNPKPMMVRPVRIHARRVRSAAKKTRGSDM